MSSPFKQKQLSVQTMPKFYDIACILNSNFRNYTTKSRQSSLEIGKTCKKLMNKGFTNYICFGWSAWNFTSRTPLFSYLPSHPIHLALLVHTSKKSLRSKTYLFTDGARTSIDSAAMADYRRVLLVCHKNKW